MKREVWFGRLQRSVGKRQSDQQSGVTLLELVVVAAVAIVVMAIAIPNIMTVIYNIKLRGSADSISGLLQQARIQAVKNNKYYGICSTKFLNCNKNGTDPANIIYVDLNGNGSWDPGEPLAQLSGNVAVATVGNPSPATMAVGPNLNPQPANRQVFFNARGLPCIVSGATCLTTVVVATNTTLASYRFYITDSRGFGRNGWASVTVSPEGRVHVWYWDGATWE